MLHSLNKKVSPSILQFAKDLRATIVKEKEGVIGTGFFDLSIPPIAGTILHKAKSVDDIIPQILHLRKTRGARAFRQWISEVQDSLRNGDASKFLNLSDQVEGLRKQMLLEFGLEKKEKEPSGLSVSLWIFSYSPQIPRWLYKGLYKFTSKAHVQFLYDNIKRSTTISSLMPDIARLFWPNTHQEEHFLFPNDDQNNDHHDLKPFDYSNYLKEESRNVQ